MALVLDDTKIITADGVPVVFPKDAAANVAPMLSGVDSTGAIQVVGATTDGRLKVDAALSVENINLGNVEITNDLGNPIPCTIPNTDFPDAAANAKLDEVKTKLDAIITNTENIHVDVGAVNVNTDTLESLSAATNAKLDTLLAKPGVAGSSNAYFCDENMVALTNAFVARPFGFTSFSISLTNDGAVTEGYIEYSFDGTTVHGRINNGEGFAHDFQAQPSIWLRGQNGGEKYRLGAY